MKISFVITCKGRLDQLMVTLPHNMNMVQDDPDVEFVVLNYDSPDDLDAWALLNLKGCPNVVYGHALDEPYYRSPHSKNVASALATGDVLCAIDADNFFGMNYAQHLRDLWGADREGVYAYPSKRPDGTGGRIAINREDFFAVLRGYDEAFDGGWSCDDTDIEWRCRRAGFDVRRMDGIHLQTISHSDARREEYMRMSVEDSKVRNAHLLRWSKQSGIVAANSGEKWGVARVRVNWGHIVETGCE